MRTRDKLRTVTAPGQVRYLISVPLEHMPDGEPFRLIYNNIMALTAGCKQFTIGRELQEVELATLILQLPYRLKRKLTSITDVICK